MTCTIVLEVITGLSAVGALRLVFAEAAVSLKSGAKFDTR